MVEVFERGTSGMYVERVRGERTWVTTVRGRAAAAPFWGASCRPVNAVEVHAKDMVVDK